MGKTIVEKILARSSGRASVSPDDYIEVTSRCPVTLGGDVADTMHRGPQQADSLGVGRVFNPEMVNVIMSHAGSSTVMKIEEQRARVTTWARAMGVPEENIIGIGWGGIEHIAAAERAWVLPGEVFFQAVDGHTATLGGVGAFAVSLSYAAGAYLVTGHIWLQVPRSARFNLTGRMPEGVMARDVFEYILGQIGPSGAVGQVMEWTGPVVEAMSMDARFALCCQALFTGAWTGIVNPDETTFKFFEGRTTRPYEPLVSDPDARYARVHNFDVTGLVPQVVSPASRHAVKPVSETLGAKITAGFIGACSNGRMEDMRMAARILKGRQLPGNVMLNITPGSVEVLRQCLGEGLIDIFVAAGAVVPSPCCGMCYGGNTPLGKGEVCISTSTCNDPGRMGSREAEIYLASPATVAASCLEGRIADPRDYL